MHYLTYSPNALAVSDMLAPFYRYENLQSS